MRRRHILCVFAAFILLLAISAMISNVVGSSAGIDLSGNDPVVLKPSTKSFFRKARGRIALTYFVSSKDKMPADMMAKRPDPAALEISALSTPILMKKMAPDTLRVRR